MHPVELSILLHRAVEARVGRILELSARDGWLDDADALHDVRVASRRLRAALALVDPQVYPGFKKHRRRAGILTGALGRARAMDVHLAKLASLGAGLTMPAGHEVLEHALEVFDRRRRKAGRAMLGRLSRLEFQAFGGLLEVPALPRPFESRDLGAAVDALLAPALDAALGPLVEELQVEDPAGLHRIRIGIKKLRYALEILAGALPLPPEAWLERLRGLQTALGEHHDWAELEAGLWAHHAALTTRQRPALASGLLDLLGEVVERRRAAFEELRAAWPGPGLREARQHLLHAPGESA